MEKLMPDQLKDLWKEVEQKELTPEAFQREEELKIAGYQKLWQEALCQERHTDLQESLLKELGNYLKCDDMGEIKRRCQASVAMHKEDWETNVDPNNGQSIESHYAENESVLYELMWWHSLIEDNSPLAYVTALCFARQHGCRQYLDYGSGVGSGGLLFAREGREVTLADISSPLLRFCRWRFEQRNLHGTFLDLKTTGLPENSFDLITAMDVFEHLVDPVETVEILSKALTPGGFLFARLGGEEDEDRPEHIVHDFEPTFARLRELGLEQVWQDEWLWGHQVFQKK